LRPESFENEFVRGCRICWSWISWGAAADGKKADGGPWAFNVRRRPTSWDGRVLGLHGGFQLEASMPERWKSVPVTGASLMLWTSGNRLLDVGKAGRVDAADPKKRYFPKVFSEVTHFATVKDRGAGKRAGHVSTNVAHLHGGG